MNSSKQPGFAPENRGGTGGGGATFPDAPTTGDTYGRNNAAWRITPTVHTHTQSAPSNIWNIQHNIGRRPVSCVTLDAGGDRIIGEEDWTASTLNLLIVRFSEPVAGVAHVKY